MRHATAIDETLALGDPMRMLTAHGRTQARRLGDGLRGRGCALSHVWTSPLVRAVQTAELVAAAVGATCTVDVAPDLAPEASPRALVARLGALPADAIALVVGHEPNLSALGSLLLGDPSFVALAKAEAVRIVDREVRWRLAWNAAAPISAPSLS